jgi:hypothetical protein
MQQYSLAESCNGMLVKQDCMSIFPPHFPTATSRKSCLSGSTLLINLFDSLKLRVSLGLLASVDNTKIMMITHCDDVFASCNCFDLDLTKNIFVISPNHANKKRKKKRNSSLID